MSGIKAAAVVLADQFGMELGGPEPYDTAFWVDLAERTVKAYEGDPGPRDVSHDFLKRTEKERAQRDLEHGVPWQEKVARGLGVEKVIER